eukprot:CAMPEP_0171057974 /NCGR_PEP_ID=MMETSP0766_2-20121228/2165_1 /TAXON_ID=439317 /ORGANISM="Gambierdiscus australes, Strain CAWD 149" /LENGTH=464 /DNA_ID=CAMNT_0011513183 /DNA_START=46 /DNA_END=1440 /DNA_ORIENTATION=+
MPPVQRRVLVIGGGFSGLCVARDLRDDFLVTVIDAKEFFEYTPGILRAYVHPKHFDALTFTLQPVLEAKMGCKYLWGEVMKLDGPGKTATIQPMFSNNTEDIDFDFCVIASGCNFGPFHQWGESLWFPVIHAEARLRGNTNWPHIDERFIEGRRRHILEEYASIQRLNEKEATILVVGAGFIGVEWVTELQYYFPKLDNTIIDFLPAPLGPLPNAAKKYCKKYMAKKGIKQKYEVKYAPKEAGFYQKLDFKATPDKEYICIGVKASNYFMPKETLSEKGPGGGGWILMDMTLAVETREGYIWSSEDGYARIYAVGDCNTSGISAPNRTPDEWPIPPIPKISYPGEEEAVIACKNIVKIDKLSFRGEKHDLFGGSLDPHTMHWPWGAGMFATSLGPNDACFVLGANWEKGSGYTVIWGAPCALQKWFIEWSKVNECANGVIGRVIWHFVHHTPVHLFGGGPRWGY